jgi:hypothetical protein
MTDAELEQFALALPGVEKRYAFNGEGFYVRARLFAFLEPGGIVARLPEDERQAALQVEGARLWTMPRTSERREWVFVPTENLSADELSAWLAASAAMVSESGADARS